MSSVGSTEEGRRILIDWAYCKQQREAAEGGNTSTCVALVGQQTPRTTLLAGHRYVVSLSVRMEVSWDMNAARRRGPRAAADNTTLERT